MKRNVIAMLNMKGGVGKTTLCKEIAYYLSANDKKVLLVDVDPQGNLTQSIFEKFNFKHHYESETERNKDYKICTATISNVFEYTSIVESVKMEDFILNLNKNLAIIPGDLNAVFFERSSGGSESENALKNFMEDFEIREKYDYIFLDCPPTFSFYTTAALLSSDFYMSPIHPDSYSILGIDLLFQVVDRLKKVYRDRFKAFPLDHLGVIFSNIPRDGSIQQGMKDMLKDIQESEVLSSLNVNFFKEPFRINAYIPKKIDYFIADSNSDFSYENLRKIVRELDQNIIRLKTPVQQ
ncbi:ParA family protein [Metabacillus halosaccharovorans]|uniref:ParA family protein n=1 Tax=Metabacillus halosaccharovorans TaxID=930124 RepID=UPI001C1FCFFA|nr:ParA family protein [Metabacillus halosaccharovorans]MBU7595729.1 AAA family ATPase [Metabacillus halosaccharovorans]